MVKNTMMMKGEKMSEQQQLKAELERYFTAVVDEQYLKQYPDVTSPLGTPMFYDENGQIDAEYISEMTGMSPGGVLTSYEAWQSNGGIPPHKRPRQASRVEAAASPLSRPVLGQIEVPERRQSGSFLSEIKDDMNDALEMRRMEQQFDSMNQSQHFVPQQSGSTSDITTIIAALAPLLKQDRPSIDPMTMTLMKQLNDRTTDSTSQMIALFNMNQQANQQWMTMLMDQSRGGSRSSLEDRLLNHSLDKMLSGGETPEDSIWSELVRSGQLGDMVQGAAAGIAGIANRRAPMGANPYGQEEVEQKVLIQPPPTAEELVPTFEAAPPEPVTMTYQEKCTHIMNEMMPTLPTEWTSDGNTMQMLMNSVELSVRRGEDTYPTSTEMQLAQAAKEMLVIANLRTVGTSLNKIEKGEIGIDLAATVLSQHPLWPVFQTETVDSFLMTVNAYSVADLPDSPSLLHDLEYLNRPTTRPIIESLLDTARGGTGE